MERKMDDNLRDFLDKKLSKKLHLIPEHMHRGLSLYLLEGVLPGDFLLSILSNDLKGSFGRADHINKPNIENWVNFIVNEIPSDAQGSTERVEKWAKFATRSDEFRT